MASPVNDTYTAASGATVYAGRSASAAAAFLATMSAGSCKAIPNSDLASAAYANDTTNSYSDPALGADYNAGLATEIAGNVGPKAVMASWSGGTPDTARERLIIGGGGHQDYYGSERYAFETQAALRWKRLTTPSTYVGCDCQSPILPNGSPVPKHLYETEIYAEAIDSVVSIGVPFPIAGGCANFSDSLGWTLALNCATRAWSTLTETYTGGNVFTDLLADIDPSTGLIYSVAGNWGLSKFDPATSVWSDIGGQFGPGRMDFRMVCAMRPGVALVGAGHLANLTQDGPALNIFDLATGDRTIQTITGDTTAIGYQGPEGDGAPGFVWNSTIGKFVWFVPGDRSLYYLDPATWVCTKVALTGDIPDAEPAGYHGIFGRFQYFASRNFYIAAPTYDGNVFIIKPPEA